MSSRGSTQGRSTSAGSAAAAQAKEAKLQAALEKEHAKLTAQQGRVSAAQTALTAHRASVAAGTFHGRASSGPRRVAAQLSPVAGFKPFPRVTFDVTRTHLPTFYKAVYGQDQVRAALNQFGKSYVRDVADRANIAYPKSATKAQILDRIETAVAKVPYDDAWRQASDDEARASIAAGY